MKLSELSIRGIAGLPDLQANLTAPTGVPHDLVVVSGPPASGKTRLCDLVVAALEAIGPYEGIVRSESWMGADPHKVSRVDFGLWMNEEERATATPVANPSRASVTFVPGDVVSEAERGVRRLLERYDHDPEHGKREYLPEGRQRAWGRRKDGLGELEQMLLRVSKEPQKYSFVPRLIASLGQDAPRRARFASALEGLAPKLRLRRLDPDDHPERVFETPTNPMALYEELTAGEADAVILAATIALTGLSHSIVIIDRPELYVPEHRLVAWSQSLLGLGLDNQWILATGNAALAASVDPLQHIALGR